jgi:hypothetical protein
VRAALVALALAGLAGCGGGAGGDPEAYRKAGDAACTDYQQAIAGLAQPAKPTDLGPYIEKALPVLTRTVDRLEKLDPPGDLRDAYETFRNAARKTVARAEALRQAAQDADAGEVQRLLAEAAEASTKRVGLARDAGLEACAQI